METKSKTYLIIGWLLVIFVILFLLFPLSSVQSAVPCCLPEDLTTVPPTEAGACACVGNCCLSGGTLSGELITEWLMLILIAIGVFMLTAYYYADKNISLSKDFTTSVNNTSALFNSQPPPSYSSVM